MIEWFAKRATQKKWWYIIVTTCGVIIPIILSSTDPGDKRAFLYLGCIIGSQLFAWMYCAICELAAEILKLRAEISDKFGK
jgi:hypothetical protein